MRCSDQAGDRHGVMHMQAQGIGAIPPDLLSIRPEYPLQIEMTPLPAKKRSKRAEGAEASSPVYDGATGTHASAVQDEFIAL